MNTRGTRYTPGLLGLVLLAAFDLAAASAIAAPPRPLESFVETNGTRLQVLDWGGSGRVLILIHGLGDNPWVFQDLAPAFTDRFHVLAYARRGSGGSQVGGPYDGATLAKDLLGLMDALDIKQADLVGYSAGGVEITRLATEHPDRVSHLVYFDGAYDAADPDARAMIHALPVGFFDPPKTALVSVSAYRAYLNAVIYPSIDDPTRIEANVRQKVLIHADGGLSFRLSSEVVAALYDALENDTPRDYSHIRCPTLAIFGSSLYDLHVADEARRSQLERFEKQYWAPFELKSIAKLKRELPSAEIAHIEGSHESFFLTHRAQVVRIMRQFLMGSGGTKQ